MEKETFLYVLLLPHMDKEYNLSYKVKFGYTEDFKQRMKTGYEAYYGEDGYQVLHVYNGNFTQSDEFAIKQYLQEYSLFKNEWFKCCQGVLGFFNTYDTSEKLKKKISEIPVKKSGSKFHVSEILLNYVIQTYHNDLKEIEEIQAKWNNLEEVLREYTEGNQYKYLREIYGFSLPEFIQYRTDKLQGGSTEKSCELAVDFNDLPDSKSKLKMLVSLKDIEGITEKDINSFLELIQPKYKRYYTIMGPEFIKRFSCKEAEIKREWENIKSNTGIQEEVREKIYNAFEIGKRYTKVDIKDTLKKLYSKLGYQKTAKATDLEEYFKVKPILTSDKKHGVEILEKR